MSNRSTLLSLAYLKVHWDSNRGIFLDNFIPFVVEALKTQADAIVSTENLQENLLTKFGIRIPQSVIKALLYRMRKQRYVNLKNHIFYKNDEKLKTLEFSIIQNEVQRIFSALIFDFISYSKENYNAVVTEKDAEDALLSFISYNQFLIYQSGDEQEKLIDEVVAPSSEMKYIVAKYIYEAVKSKPEIYNYLDVIVKGYMIAQVLYLSDAHQTGKSFKKTQVFFDTSFIIFALGYSGEQYKNPSLELLDLLYQSGAILYCFEHTYEEIKGILAACSKKLGVYSDNQFGRTVQYFTSVGYKSSDVEILISRLKKDIEKLGIKIVPIPNYDAHQYEIDENELFEMLKEKMPHQRDDIAIQRDVSSISAIYRARQNNYSSAIEDSGAVFVTTSATLVRTSNAQFYKTNDKLIAPPCLSDYILTNLLWLKTPNLAPNLPMKRIIADSYAAIQPDNKVIHKWSEEVGKLKSFGSISEEDYYYFRSSQDAIDILMDSTLGDADAITEGSVYEITDKVKERFRLQAESKYRSSLDDKEKTLVSYEKQLISERRMDAERDSNVRNRAKKIAKVIANIIKILTYAAILVIVLISLPIIGGIDLLDILGLNRAPLYLSIGVLVILFVYGFFSSLSIFSIPSILRNIEVKIQNYVYAFLKSLAS